MGLELEEGDEVFFRIYWPSVKKKTCIAIFFRSLVGRGNLNLLYRYLIYISFIGLKFSVEYCLEYLFPRSLYLAWNFEPTTVLGCTA